MLRDLHVRNLAVVDQVSLEMGPGLNVLTGETGAGKSIVVDSLALLAGARANQELIRTGAETLTVTGTFEPAGSRWREPLEEAGLELDGPELVVRREISREGRNRTFLNDQPITLRLLGELAPFLLRIHGQREELGLTTPDLQRIWLDRSGGDEADSLLAAVTRAYEAYRSLAGRLERIAGGEQVRRERIDLLRFQLDELDKAGLRPGEDEELRRERDVLRHAEAIQGALGGAHALLFEDEESASERLDRAAGLLGEIEDWVGEAKEWTGELDELRIRAEELARSLRRQLDGVDGEPGRLDAVEQRLALVERLCRKYGGSVDEVLARKDEMAAELAELADDATDRKELELQVEAALAAYREVAAELSGKRRAWAAGLTKRMHSELADLALAKATFAVGFQFRGREGSPLEIDGRAVEFGRQGYDQVVFELAPNPGEEARPLARIASGGELSRLYLGLQLAAQADRDREAPTLVFDEVDAGIGGAVAEALGRKLKRLASGGQILVVTHLPQVASFADRHYRVTKAVSGGRTRTEVTGLEEEARVEEVARMLAGREVTRASVTHAQELIASSRES